MFVKCQPKPPSFSNNSHNNASALPLNKNADAYSLITNH